MFRSAIWNPTELVPVWIVRKPVELNLCLRKAKHLPSSPDPVTINGMSGAMFASLFIFVICNITILTYFGMKTYNKKRTRSGQYNTHSFHSSFFSFFFLFILFPLTSSNWLSSLTLKFIPFFLPFTFILHFSLSLDNMMNSKRNALLWPQLSNQSSFELFRWLFPRNAYISTLVTIEQACWWIYDWILWNNDPQEGHEHWTKVGKVVWGILPSMGSFRRLQSPSKLWSHPWSSVLSLPLECVGGTLRPIPLTCGSRQPHKPVKTWSISTNTSGSSIV